MEATQQHQRYPSDFSILSNFSSSLASRIQNIEQNLNKACCHHDSLMPVLELADYLPHISKWQLQFKNINRKINDYEKQMNLISKQFKQTTPTSTQKDRDTLIHKIQINSHKCQADLRLIQDQVLNKNITLQPLKSTSAISHTVQKKISEATRYNQTYLASFKNEIEMQQHQKQFDDQKIKQIIQQSIKCQFTNSIQQITLSIQIIKSQLPPIDLLQFHSFNLKRLNSEILQCEQLARYYQKHKQLSKDKLLTLITRVDEIQWQIKGMKKKYLRQLTNLYCQKNNQQSISLLENRLVKDIENLQTQYKSLEYTMSAII